jgi:hypothetical protein
MIHPDKTLPPSDSTRAYPFPSCPACYRIAHRRGLEVGIEVLGGTVEAFSHTTEGPVALIYTPEGFVTILPLGKVLAVDLPIIEAGA